MKRSFLWVALSALTILCFSACERDEEQGPNVPYIASLEIQGDTLFIKGDFGTVTGSVTINNQTVAAEDIRSWTETTIVCILDQSWPEEIEVEVIVKEKKSNRKKITRTTGTQHYISYLVVDEALGRLFIYGKFDPQRGSVKVNNSTGGTTGSDYDCGHITANWGDIDMTIEKTAGFTDLSGRTHFQVRKEHLPDGFNIQLDVSFWEIIPATVTTSPCVGNSTIYQYMQSSDLIGMDGLTDLPLRFEPGTNNIKTDSITETVSSSAKLIWNAERGSTLSGLFLLFRPFSPHFIRGYSYSTLSGSHIIGFPGNLCTYTRFQKPTRFI